MLSGGDVRPLALVVIGRGQITTPYILVIPSEGDYCFPGRLFSFLCSILPSPNDHKHKQSRADLWVVLLPLDFWHVLSLLFLSSSHGRLVCMPALLWMLLAILPSAFNFFFFFLTFMRSFIQYWASFKPSSTTTASIKTIQLQTTTDKRRILICQTDKATVPLISVS